MSSGVPRPPENNGPSRLSRRLGGLVCLVGLAVLVVPHFRSDDVESDALDPSAPESAASEPLLPEADRQFLWDAEHYGLELSKSGWGPFLSAWKDLDAEGLSASLAEEFVATWPTAVTPIDAGGSGFVASRLRATDKAQKPLGGEQFVNELIALRRLFGDGVRPHFKLLGIEPADRTRRDGDWKGRGRITFSGPSGDGGPLDRRLSVQFRVVFPEPENLEQGHWLLECQVDRLDRVSADRYLLTDVTSETGIHTARLHDNWLDKQRVVNAGGVYLCDYNRDGCIDMLVTDSFDFDGLILYEGLPTGGFDDVSRKRGLPRAPYSIDAIFADLDGDGWEDLVLPGRLVLRNDRGQRFEDVTERTNLDDLVYAVGKESGLDSLSGASVVDYDRDGRIDLYVTRADASGFSQGSWIDGKSGESFGNQLLKNLGDWQFEDVTQQARASGDQRSTFTSVWLDANNDRWPDVYVIHEFGAGLLLVNQEGEQFEPVELDERSSDFGSMGLSCGDFDNDGLTDLYVSNMFSSAGNRVMDNLPSGFYDDLTSHKLRRMVSGNQLHKNLGNLHFEGIADELDVAQVGWGWGPSIADFNNDGWLDIYAPCGFMSRDRQKPDG